MAEIPEELRKALEEKFPGFEIKTIGDTPESEIPPHLLADLDQKMANFRNSLVNGVCEACGKKYPLAWPPEEAIHPDWSLFWDGESDDADPMFLTCNECDEKIPHIGDPP